MKAPIETFFSEHLPKFTQALEEFEQHIDPAARPDSDLIADELSRCIESFLEVCAALEGQFRADQAAELKQLQARFRDAIAPWFQKSWFMQRALAKPRGYPGDYELLSAIYDGQPRSLGIGGYLDRYFLGTTLANAVCARVQSLRRFLIDEISRREEGVAILNVACGTCREYTTGFEIAGERHARIICLDNDTQALDYVQANVMPTAPEGLSVTLQRYNALRMTSAPVNRERFGRSDIIYSVGLCDYIPDDYLIPILKGWRESLQDGGVVYVAFKDALRYDKTPYQWLTDWYFYQRVEEDFQHLFAAAGYDMDTLEVTRDSTGVIMNYIARNKVESIVRIDASQPTAISQPAFSGADSTIMKTELPLS
jgi:extracellular factor (EF) 3-hydroxypalmitic acid methyl ester biosynthesis protein